MEKEICIKKGWLLIPVCAAYGELPFGGAKNNRMLEIFCREKNGETKLFEFQIPAGQTEDETYPVSYYARFPVKQFTDKTLILRGDLGRAFFDGIRNEDVPAAEKKYFCNGQGEAFRRPSIHFTPQTGWMNDPNGLVYADGVYHLYFQHNPFDVQWENMSWGHAVSKDLLHWEQKDDVLFPDETGTMFSGSGIVNDRKMLGLPEDALVFFYTAAGNNNKWSAGKQFTQRIAYSTDLLKWEQTDGVRHAAYINKMAYAAQTYSNTGNRVISVPWLRFPNRGRNYTGAMGLPREFSVAYKNGEKVLRQEPVREYEDSRKPVYDNTMKNVRQQDTENEAPMADTAAKVADEHVSAKDLFQWKFAPDTATEIQITRAESEDILSACINQKTDFVYNAKTGELKIGEETFATGVGIRDFSLLFDDVILEVTADCGTITGIFELPEIAEKFCMEKGSIEKIQVFGEEVWQP